MSLRDRDGLQGGLSRLASWTAASITRAHLVVTINNPPVYPSHENFSLPTPKPSNQSKDKPTRKGEKKTPQTMSGQSSKYSQWSSEFFFLRVT